MTVEADGVGRQEEERETTRAPDDSGLQPPSVPPRRRLFTVLPIVLGFVAIGLAVKLFSESQVNAGSVALAGAVSSPYKFTAGTPAPNFTVQSLDGRAISLQDMRGKTVIVNFWATWCAPCRSEMPDMEQLSRERGDELVVLAVNVQEAKEPVRRFVEQYGLTFPIGFDTAGEVTQAFGVQSLPTTFFIDREGRVCAFNMGALNKSAMARKLDTSCQ